MKKAWVCGFLLSATVILALAAPQQAAPQVKAANIYKEIMEKKEILNWRPAPDGQPPADVCTMLQSCSGSVKIMVQPTATEGGKKVTRALYLTKSSDGKNTDQVVLERLTPGSEAYFFLVAPDGSMSKGAYDQTGTRWMAVGNTVGGPAFNQDVKTWDAWLSKANAPAPAPAASN